MATKTYREQCAANVAKAGEKKDKSYEYASERLGAEKGAKARSASVATTPITIENMGTQIPQLLAIMTKKSEAVAVRLAAMDVISAATFMGPAYLPHKPDIQEALRTLVTDKSVTIRERALEQLSLDNDSYARDELKKSLRNPDKKIINTAKAIQLLGADDHGEASDIARELYDKLDNKAKEEALRVLATDPKSSALLEKLMTDKEAKAELRQISAYGLRKLDPDTFLDKALRVISDPDDDPKVQTAYMTGAQKQAQGMVRETANDFKDKIGKLHAQTSSRNLKKAARKYLKWSDETK